jgi:recombinational DNA repair ATPase RecF
MRHGGARGEDAWSSGLADQTYLALRLGMARQFGLRAEPLPLILDDLLVRFDEERRLGAAKVLLEIAREHQVLLFSCHNATREIFATLLAERAKRCEESRFDGEKTLGATPLRVSCFTLSRGEIRETPLPFPEWTPCPSEGGRA